MAATWAWARATARGTRRMRSGGQAKAEEKNEEDRDLRRKNAIDGHLRQGDHRPGRGERDQRRPDDRNRGVIGGPARQHADDLAAGLPFSRVDRAGDPLLVLRRDRHYQPPDAPPPPDDPPPPEKPPPEAAAPRCPAAAAAARAHEQHQQDLKHDGPETRAHRGEQDDHEECDEEERHPPRTAYCPGCRGGAAGAPANRPNRW